MDWLGGFDGRQRLIIVWHWLHKLAGLIMTSVASGANPTKLNNHSMMRFHQSGIIWICYFGLSHIHSFYHKNIFYKNIEAQKSAKIKNVLRIEWGSAGLSSKESFGKISKNTLLFTIMLWKSIILINKTECQQMNKYSYLRWCTVRE